MRRSNLCQWFLVCFASVHVTMASAASVVPAASDRGMVVTAQHLATQIGADVLAKGGNAVDAAVAVGYALAVVYPAAGNLGGGGFMTLHLAEGRETFIDFREKAPLAATVDMFLGSDGNVVKGRSTVGHLAVAVPGTVAGLELALARYGTKPRAALIAPAAKLADRGFVLDAGDVRMFQAVADGLKADPATAAIFLKGGEAEGGRPPGAEGPRCHASPNRRTWRGRLLSRGGGRCHRGIQRSRRRIDPAHRSARLLGTGTQPSGVRLPRLPRGFSTAAELGRCGRL